MPNTRSPAQRLRQWIAPPIPNPQTNPPTLDQIRQQVRQIEIQARRTLRQTLDGEFPTAFRGRGLEFAELQPYNPGDDVRSIDWKATARLRSPVIRRYVEERQQTILILVDLSASMRFAASGPPIRDRAIEIAGTLGLAAADANDLVGLAAFANDIILAVPPAKGPNHVLRILRDLLALPANGRTEMARALRYAGRVMRKRGVIIIISDFIPTHPDHIWEPDLARIAKRHDVVAICLRDPKATILEPAAQSAIVHWGGAERGDRLLADAQISRIQQTKLENERRQLLARLRQCGCDPVIITTDDDWTPQLLNLFRQRRKRP